MRRAIILGLAVAASAMANLAWADAAPKKEVPDAATERARALHVEGDALYEKGDFARAYAAYTAAWSLKKHYQIAGNLGDCEMQLGKYRDAAEHLAIFLRDDPTDRSGDRYTGAMALFKEARAHVGAIEVTTSAGAAVFVDGASVGVAPIHGEIFVDPGLHQVEARRGAEVGWASVRLGEGEAEAVTVKLSSVRGPSEGGEGRELSARSAVLWSGTALGVVGLGTGVGMMLLARGAGREADEKLAELRKGGTVKSPCGAGNTNQAECGHLSTLRSEQHTLQMISIGAFAVGGAAAISAIVAGAMTHKKPVRSKVEGSAFVTPGSAGFVVVGSF